MSTQKAEIVQFGNGQYAIRKGSNSNRYLDLKSINVGGTQHWWRKGESYWNDCLTKNLETAEKCFALLSAYDEEQIVKIIKPAEKEDIDISKHTVDLPSPPKHWIDRFFDFFAV